MYNPFIRGFLVFAAVPLLALGAWGLVNVPAALATPQCGPNSVSASGYFFSNYESAEYSPDGLLTYHFRNLPTYSDGRAFQIFWTFFDDECGYMGSIPGSTLGVALPPGVTDWSVRLTSANTLEVWDDQHEVVVTSRSLPDLPEYVSIALDGMIDGGASGLHSRFMKVNPSGEPPVHTGTLPIPEGRAAMTAGGYYFDTYEHGEYVDGLLRVHFRLKTPYNDGRTFASGLFASDTDCSNLVAVGANGAFNMAFPPYMRYYSFRMTSPTHWEIWNDETNQPITCGGCAGDVPVTTKLLTFNAFIDGGASVLHATPFAPTEVQTPVCTINCYSNVMFLPGIESSRLYRPDYNGGTDKLWEPGENQDVQDLYLKSDGASARPDIYAREGDVLDEIPVTGSNVYKSFLADLNTWQNIEHLIADYGVVSYDWRLSLDDILNYGNQVNDRLYYSGDLRATSTPYIIQELRGLAQSSKTGKVTIVAHSNGGLVAKALLKRLEETNDPLLEKVDSLVLVAVPQVGTPQALGAILHGYDQGLPNDWLPLILTPQTARDFASTSPMAYHLLPAASYISSEGSEVRTPVVTFDDGELTQPFIDTYGHAIGNSTELHNFLVGDEGRSQPASGDLNNPIVLSPSLLAYGEAEHASLDGWTPPTTVHVHEVAGWGEDTLASIRYSTGVECVNVSVTYTCLEHQPKLQYSPETVIDGDGTVVVPSALAMSDDLPNVSRWWVNLEDYNRDNRPTIFLPNLDHADIFEVQQLRQLLKSISTSEVQSLPQYISSSQPLPDEGKRLHFILHSPLNLSAHDSLGHQISATVSSIPGAKYKRFGEVQYLSVPASVAPTLHLDGYDTGSFTLEVEEVLGNTVVATTTFAGIPSATTTKAVMSFSDGTIANASPLTVDQDGDGATDLTLAPKLNGIVVPDIGPPTTTLSLGGILGNNGWYRSNVPITFSATDSGSGVAATYFSINGAATSTGTTTTITSEGIHSLLYYSIDNAGNREASINAVIKIDKTAPEAIISASTTTKDLIVTETDALSTTTVIKTATSTRITDQAGNTTTLVFQETFSGGFLTYAKLSSIQYGTTTLVALPSSFLYVWNTKLSPPVLVSQTVVADKTFAVQALYDKSKNKTTVIVLKKSTPIQTTSVPGLAIIKLTTNKGAIHYSW